MGRYQFTHALIQETLAAELSTTRKVRLHSRIAQALEHFYGANAEANAAELAFHFGEAEAVLGPDKLVRFSHLAGEGALARYAWEDALDHFRRGLAAKGSPLEGVGPAQDSDEAEFLYGYGRAMAGAGERAQLQLAVDSVGRAFDFYHSAGETAKALEVAEYPLPVVSGGRSAIAAFYSRALELVEPDSPTAARLLSSHGEELGRIEGDYPGAQQDFGRALAIARKAEDVQLEMRILAASGQVDYFHLRPDECLAKAISVIEFALPTDDPRLELDTRLNAARILTSKGDPEGARQHSTASLELGEKLRNRIRLAMAFRTNGNLCRLLGEWSRAQDISDRGLAVAPGDPLLLVDRASVEYELGEWERGESFLERFVRALAGASPRAQQQLVGPAVTLAYIARITESFDLLDLAVTIAEGVLGSPYAGPALTAVARAGLASVAILRRDIQLAQTEYTFLNTTLNSAFPMFGPSPINLHRLRGLLAQTMGNPAQAAAHFEESLAFCRKAGLPARAGLDLLRLRRHA